MCELALVDVVVLLMLMLAFVFGSFLGQLLRVEAALETDAERVEVRSFRLALDLRQACKPFTLSLVDLLLDALLLFLFVLMRTIVEAPTSVEGGGHRAFNHAVARRKHLAHEAV